MTDNKGKIDIRVIEGIITEYQDPLFRFAFFRTGSFADAQDIVQDVFLKFYRRQKYLLPVLNIKSYLLKSISNACYDYQQRKKNQVGPIDERLDNGWLPENDASHRMLLQEEQKRIEKLLRALPIEQSEIVRLRVVDNLPFVEIAVLLSLPVTTVKSRFKYGIDKLRNILSPKNMMYEL